MKTIFFAFTLSTLAFASVVQADEIMEVTGTYSIEKVDISLPESLRLQVAATNRTAKNNGIEKAVNSLNVKCRGEVDLTSIVSNLKNEAEGKLNYEVRVEAYCRTNQMIRNL